MHFMLLITMNRMHLLSFFYHSRFVFFHLASKLWNSLCLETQAMFTLQEMWPKSNFLLTFEHIRLFFLMTEWTAQTTWNLIFQFRFVPLPYVVLTIQVRCFAMWLQSEQTYQNSCDFYVTLDQHLSQICTHGATSKILHTQSCEM